MGNRAVDPTRIAVIVGMGLVTYLFRVAPQVLFVGRTFSETFDRYLRYLAYALISSLISTSLFLSGSRFEATAAPHRAVALLAAIFVAAWCRRPLVGMLTGALLAVLLAWLRGG